MKRKILYSPEYGAGWVTWNRGNPEVASLLLTYQPIIEFLESGGRFTDDEIGTYSTNYKPSHPLLQKLLKECEERFGEDSVYLGGACDLKVKEVNGLVRIEEYDGYESVKEEGTFTDWM